MADNNRIVKNLFNGGGIVRKVAIGFIVTAILAGIFAITRTGVTAILQELAKTAVSKQIEDSTGANKKLIENQETKLQHLDSIVSNNIQKDIDEHAKFAYNIQELSRRLDLLDAAIADVRAQQVKIDKQLDRIIDILLKRETN